MKEIDDKLTSAEKSNGVSTDSMMRADSASRPRTSHQTPSVKESMQARQPPLSLESIDEATDKDQNIRYATEEELSDQSSRM